MNSYLRYNISYHIMKVTKPKVLFISGSCNELQPFIGQIYEK